MRGDILDLRSLTDRHLGSLVALNKVSLSKLSPKVFDQILNSNSTARVLAWENLTHQTARAISHASDLAKKHAIEKLASFIFECQNRRDNHLRDNHIVIPIRRRDLAEYLGMQPETISRCFKELEERGIINVTDLNAIKLEQPSTLRRLANGDREAGNDNRPNCPEYKILVAGA